jgi:hypothetical protein
MGITLEESIENLEALESNGMTAYIDSQLKGFLAEHGAVNIDYVKTKFGRNGYTISVGNNGCSPDKCSSC